MTARVAIIEHDADGEFYFAMVTTEGAAARHVRETATERPGHTVEIRPAHDGETTTALVAAMVGPVDRSNARRLGRIVL